MTTHELQINNAEISRTVSAILVYDPLVISSPFILCPLFGPNPALSVRPELGHVNTDHESGQKAQSLSAGSAAFPCRLVASRAA